MTITDNDNFPVAWVTRREPNRTNPGFVLLTVLCPFCERTHHHGGLKDDTDHGHRVADCIHKVPGNYGYMVRETTTSMGSIEPLPTSTDIFRGRTIQHTCPTKHRTPRTIATCLWPTAAWVLGQGEYALLAHCDVLTVSLHATAAAAESSKAMIDQTACGHACHRHHEIVRLAQ